MAVSYGKLEIEKALGREIFYADYLDVVDTLFVENGTVVASYKTVEVLNQLGLEVDSNFVGEHLVDVGKYASAG